MPASRRGRERADPDERRADRHVRGPGWHRRRARRGAPGRHTARRGFHPGGPCHRGIRQHLRRGGAAAVCGRAPLGQALLRAVAAAEADGGDCGHARNLGRLQFLRGSGKRPVAEDDPLGRGLGVPRLGRRELVAAASVLLARCERAGRRRPSQGRVPGPVSDRRRLHSCVRPDQPAPKSPVGLARRQRSQPLFLAEDRGRLRASLHGKRDQAGVVIGMRGT